MTRGKLSFGSTKIYTKMNGRLNVANDASETAIARQLLRKASTVWHAIYI